MTTDVAAAIATPHEVMQRVIDSANNYAAELQTMRSQLGDVEATKANMKNCKRAADKHAAILEQYKLRLSAMLQYGECR